MVALVTFGRPWMRAWAGEAGSRPETHLALVLLASAAVIVALHEVAAASVTVAADSPWEAAGPIVAGSPQQVLDRLAEFKQACGLDRHLFHMDTGALPQEALFESLELLTTEVLPKLRDA